jgi:hypothetical protein
MTARGRIFYGLAIAGIGVLHLIYKGFRGLILAIQPENPEDYQFRLTPNDHVRRFKPGFFVNPFLTDDSKKSS